MAEQMYIEGIDPSIPQMVYGSYSTTNKEYSSKRERSY